MTSGPLVSGATAECLLPRGVVFKDYTAAPAKQPMEISTSPLASIGIGLLVIDLQREIPEAMKPRRIQIDGAAPNNVTQK